MSEQTVTTSPEGVVGQETMRAMVRGRYGPASEVLEMREIPIPQIGRDEVLVKVHSSSVNAMEWHLMNGKPYVFRAAFGFKPRSNTLGADVSGTVAATGPDVIRFRPGDEVLGAIGAGAYAELARAQEQCLVEKPEHVSFEEAAAVGIAGLTALQGLRDVLRVASGDRVLIIGASGGVGTYAVQVAKALGAVVTAVCSTRNVDQARALGADMVVDYEKDDITRTETRFDAIFDMPGNLTLRACKSLLAPGGRYVMVGGAKGDWLGPLFRIIRAKFLFAFGDKENANFTAASRADDLATLAGMLASGQIRSVIEDTFPLAEIAVPLDRQGGFHARAKTVIRIEGTI